MILTDEQVDYTYEKEIGNVMYDLWEQTNNQTDFLLALEHYIKNTSIIYVVLYKSGPWKSLSRMLKESEICSLSLAVSKIFQAYQAKIFYHRWNGTTNEWISQDEYYKNIV